MGKQDRTLLKRKVELSNDEAAEILESIAAQLRAGHVELADDGEKVHLDVPTRLRLGIEVKDSPKPEGLKRELELELWWLTDSS